MHAEKDHIRDYEFQKWGVFEGRSHTVKFFQTARH